jgi:hypothetical protein
MKPIWRILLVGVVALALPALSPIPASAATFTVNSNGDAGDSNLADGVCNDGTGNCTLRAAIQQANNTVDQDTIEFNITPDTIAPASQLPPISDPLVIDGLSDPTSLRIELVGTGAGLGADGLSINAADTSIRGLVIRDFDNDGIDITASATGVRIESNFIGTDAAGAADSGNGDNGIDVAGAANSIGGAGVGNLISGNGDSGAGSGIRITGAGANANIVQGNFIGTSANGSSPAIANDDHGIVITSSAHDNLIGGTTAASRNVISGNGQDGIRVQGAGVSNTIQGNFIGTDSSGTAPLPNSADGVGFRTSASSNTVGGTATGAGNVISGNADDGIQVGQVGDATTIRNGILANSISANSSLGIDLQGLNAVDANDSGDGDTGGNNLQNFPELTSAASNATTTTIGGTLNSEANKQYRLEFFSNSVCDPSGNGEGQTFLGTANVSTDSAGNAAFTASLPVAVSVGQFATGTATEIPANNTSEFSACTNVVLDPTPPAAPDTTPPTTPTTNAGPKFQKQRMFSVTWGPSTDASGPVRYDVRYREAPYNAAFGGFVNWQASTIATNALFTGTPGTTYCFSARAIDGSGNASPYGTEGCTAVPVDNPTFKHRGKWAKRTGAGYYLNTFSRTKQRGARLTLPGVQAKALSIIVTKCRRCGIIHVFFQGKLLKKINLRSKAAARQKLRFVNLTTFSSVQTGAVRIRVVSRGKLVIVEGLGVSAV